MTYRLTLAETETSLRKVARACGLEWGIAEEAGKAARWLAAFDLPGPEITLAHLQHLRGQNYRNFAPNGELAPWRATGGLLCPIITGAALADRSAQLLDGDPIKLGATAYPLLLAAMLGQAARHHGCGFTVCWSGARVDSFGDGIRCKGNHDVLSVAEIDHVCCCRSNLTPAQRPSTLAYRIDDKLFARIDELAFETYVPASEASRAGAGAGLTDND